jgi:hypothetical protein
MKPKAERDPNRPTEDDIARDALGGPKGSEELKPAEMTPQRKKKMPAGGDFDRGHAA